MSKRKHDDKSIPASNNDNTSVITIYDKTCLSCKTITSDITRDISNFSWAIQLQCSNCYETWTICKTCRALNNRMTDIRAVC